MKTQLKAKFLQYLLSNNKENEGFTLIQLLIVIFIIAILSAFVLPSFINKAKCQTNTVEPQVSVGIPTSKPASAGKSCQ